MNKPWLISILTLLNILIGCTNTTVRTELQEYKVSKIHISQDSFFDVSADKLLGETMIKEILSAKRVKGPIKGFGIKIELKSPSNSTYIMNYGGGKYFFFNKLYYETNNNLIPDSVLSLFKYKMR